MTHQSSFLVLVMQDVAHLFACSKLKNSLFPLPSSFYFLSFTGFFTVLFCSYIGLLLLLLCLSFPFCPCFHLYLLSVLFLCLMCMFSRTMSDWIGHYLLLSPKDVHSSFLWLCLCVCVCVCFMREAPVCFNNSEDFCVFLCCSWVSVLR